VTDDNVSEADILNFPADQLDEGADRANQKQIHRSLYDVIIYLIQMPEQQAV
jgi:hypothetical protein